MKNNSKFLKNTLVILGLLGFLYILTVLNLFKATKRIDFNIFNSEALPDLALFFIIAVPIIVLGRYLWSINANGSSQKDDEE